jgi:metal-responsive CopG/Arc/MetJ family transcriptional regulator
MAVEKTHLYLKLPVELLREIDALAGPRKRSAFIAAAVEQEIRRRRLAALKSEQLEAQDASERLSVN